MWSPQLYAFIWKRINAVEGSAHEMRSLTQVLMAKRGIKQLKVAAMAP